MLRSWKFVCLLTVVAMFAAALPAAAAPSLTSISPTSGYPGTQVTYTGTGFGASQGSGSVWLGNKLAGSIVSWSNTQIVAVVAATAATGSASVQQGGTWSNSIAFTVIKPNITSISPTSGYPGNQVTINGTNFGASQGSGSVWLGNKLAGSIVSWSDTQIVAVVAATALSGSCQVQQMGVWGNSVTFTVITPNISSISPTTGYPGTQVTINGTNFGASQGSGSVWLGNKLAGSIVSWSNTQVVAVVAATAASGSAIVQQGGVWSNSVAFTVIQPNITSITPTSGSAGTQVTFTGTNFGASQGSGSVWLGSKLAGSIVSWSNTEIVATVDAGSVSGSAIVQQGGVWSNSIAFTVPTPALTSVSPATARAGDEITLTGTNFGATQGSGSVWLGSKLAGSIVSWSNTEIVATVDSGSITGSAQVQQGGMWSNSIAFTVITPVVTGISPDSGRDAYVTITGTGFGDFVQGSSLVWIGTKYATALSWSDTEVLAHVASDSATGPVQVHQNGVWSNNDFIFTVPEVTLNGLFVDEFIGGGVSADGVVYLDGPAPAGGLVVALSSSEASVTVPSSVTVPEGENFAVFAIGTQTVAQFLDATITATQSAATFDGIIRVMPPGVREIYMDVDRFLANGQTTTVTVVLWTPAPAGGAEVSIAVSDPDLLTAPSSVTVPEGEFEATFEITGHGPVPAFAPVDVTAVYAGVSQELNAFIVPPSLVSVTLSPSTVEGGEEVTIEVTISEPAAAGTNILFGIRNGYTDTPEPLTIEEGETTGQTTWQTHAQTWGGLVEMLLTELGLSTIESSLVILPTSLTLDSMSISPTEVVGGGDDATLTVTLTEPAEEGGLEVDLYPYSNATVPPFVVVPEGETSVTLPVQTSVVAETDETRVRGHHLQLYRDAEFEVQPPAGNFVEALELATPTTAGGNLVTTTVTLDAAAGSGGAVIALDSSNTAVATLPSSVTVPEGETTVTFDIDTDAVVQPFDVTIRATYGGVYTRTRLTVVPTPSTVSLESLSLADYINGGEEITATVTLSGPAPEGGIEVLLGGSRAGVATIPESVTIQEGETSATFDIETSFSQYSRNVLVTATYDGLVRSSMLTVLYPE